VGVTRATGPERAALGELFAELCAIESPSGSEGACAERVVAELASFGVACDVDASGNLFACAPSADGSREGGVLLCAHLDTVPLTGPVEPVCEDGVWTNRHEAILGADNKAAVAVILLVARRLASEPLIPLELLFTVGEEDALVGAKAFDVARLRSRFGYVFDHASPIGEVVIASPHYHRIVAHFHGLAAHAGIRPETGRSAIAAAARAIAVMPLGRIDHETTANVGTIRGGAGINVVPERCHVEAEVRSLDATKADALVTELLDHLNDGANAAECDLDVTVEKLFDGYRTKPTAAQVVAAEAALRACGFTPRQIVTGGGSDANALESAGFPCTNLANGTERNHQPDERVTVAALEGMLDVALALVAEVRP
ncbi:MAG: M20/M25/M40 family metallo-hydrolase, partial [Conexibacter sp.]